MILQTLQIEHACLLLVYTLLTLINARIQKGLKGVELFVLYNGLALLGAVTVVLRGTLPDFLSIVVGNLAVMGGYWALFGSMDRLFGFSRLQRVLAMVWPLVGVLSMVWLGSIHPNTAWRLFWYSFILALQQLHLASLLLSGTQERHRMGWLPGLLLLALAAANTYRIALVLLHGAPADYRAAGPALAAIVGANACLQCGLMVSYVWMTAAQLRRDLERQASTDPLTGLLNRRALERSAGSCLRRASERFSCAAILLDLDNFKPLNDLLGHAAGDQALLTVAQMLSRHVRGGDLVARTGGDEFMVLLPNANAENAYALADRIRSSLEACALGASASTQPLTASFGVAEARPGEAWDALCLRCDNAMYAVKNQGGNAVRCHVAAGAVPARLFATAV